jgi:putative ATP-dependent endonuclease of OLD family
MKRSGDEAARPDRSPVVTLTALRILGFREIEELELELDPVTTITGERGSVKAALVDAIERCLGPSPDDAVRFKPEDFPDGSQAGIRVDFEFAERVPGVWEAREPALAGVAERWDDGRLALRVTIEARRGTGSRRDAPVEPAVRAWSDGRKASPAEARGIWARLRALSPVLVLGSNREESAATERWKDGKRAEIARLYRRLRDSRGRLTKSEIDAARSVLRDEMHLCGNAGELLLQDERVLVDVVDWQRPGEQDVTDDAVQEVLLRLIRAGLLVEAQRRGGIGPEARPIVVVDSPDARLHPILAARVWRFVHSVASQLIVTTNSSEVVATSPLRAVRRLTSRGGHVDVARVDTSKFSIDDLRRVIYHVRVKRGASLMARSWLLVEGETELWLLSEFAAMLGYSFLAEGVACIEFAQCGLSPLIRLADQLGIGWHVITDGDEAGIAYANQTRSWLAGRSLPLHLTRLDAPDVEHVLWQNGYADVFQRHAGSASQAQTPRRVISRALAKASKPLVAIRIIERAAQPGSPGVPRQLAAAIQAVVTQARRRGARA